MRTSLPDPLQQGMALFQQGQPAAAIPWFDQALALQAGNAWALHFKGYALCQLGRFGDGVPLLVRALAAQPRNALFNANLGMIRYALGEVAVAIRDLERAVEIDPAIPEAHSNLALALRESGDFEPALAAARRAVQLRPEFGGARLNLALCLLSLGRWDEAWEAYRWRPDPRVNLRDLNLAPTLPHGDRLPQPLAGAALTLHGDQGLGDGLFFMRFAAALRDAGARLRFWGEPRLGALLVRNGLAESALPQATVPQDAPASHLLWLSDLPALMGKGSFPPPARLAALPARERAIRERLAALGAPPYMAVTWRAGSPRRGKAVLAKAVDPAAFGAALRGWQGTLLSAQREPLADEARAFREGAGRPVHDLSALNADLEDVLALMQVADEYVAVSNTNVHLRAGLGKPTRVLVPWPPEYRWTREGDRSAWFPSNPLYREDRAAGWGEALARLAADFG